MTGIKGIGEEPSQVNYERIADLHRKIVKNDESHLINKPKHTHTHILQSYNSLLTLHESRNNNSHQPSTTLKVLVTLVYVLVVGRSRQRPLFLPPRRTSFHRGGVEIV